MSKTNPSHDLEASAEAARESVLTVIAIFTRTVDSVRGKYVGSGTGFVIKSDDTGSIVLTVDHVLRDFGAGDELYVRSMLLDGVRQVKAHIVHRHRWSDVAVLRVPSLRNAPCLVFEPTTFNGDGVIGVGYANPQELFSADNTFKRIPDLSPGNIIETDVAIGLHHDVSISNLEMEIVSMCGMSGSPILKATGVISMLILGDGAETTGFSYSTLLEVLKRYYKNILRQATPNITDADMDALVDPMTMVQVIDALP